MKSMEPLCRLCLEDCIDLKPIHKHEQMTGISTEDSTEQNLVELILQYLSIQIIKVECTEDPFICPACQTTIENWHQFRNTCLKNDEIYQQRLSAFVGNPVENQDDQTNLSSSTEFKKEELDDSIDHEIEQDTDVEQLDNDQHGEDYTDADEDYEAQEEEHIESKNKSNSTLMPKKRGRPKSKIIDEGSPTEMMQKSKKRAEVCTICGKFIKNLTEHMRIHNNERRHQCPYCSKAFVSLSNYYSHVNIHTRAKMYKCDLCEKQYAILNSLKQHRITHFKERIHLCPVCGKAYYQPTGLARHKRTHYEEPKIKCTECGKMFLTNSDLRKHFKKHLPEKPFSCEICNRAFNRKDNLRTHMKTHRESTASKQTTSDGPPEPEPVTKLQLPEKDA